MTSEAHDPIAVTRPGEFPRRFVPMDIDLGEWDQIEPLLDQLEAREISSPEELERWLLEASELAACLSEEGSRRHIARTCHTDDEEIERRFLHHVTEIVPRLKPRFDALNRKYLASPHRAALDRDRHLVYDRSTENTVALFREANVALQVDEERLGNEHMRITGAQTVEFRGETRTLPQMQVFLEETDRALRQESWELMTARRMKDAEALTDLLNQMVALRHRMALNADFENFRDYQHRRYDRFDYTPADCEVFHAAAEQTCVPAARELAEERQGALGVETLRPWDLAVDPLGRPPLRPFKKSEDLVAGCRRVFEKVSPALAKEFDVLIDRQLLDLDSRPSKAPGGYQSTLAEVRLPFIFMNAAGTNRDVFTLLHEGGHAFHALACRQDPLLDYRHAPLEFAEVASMGMEMMSLDALWEFYGEEEADRARRHHLELLLNLFPWIAQVDAFQHWMYLNPEHTPDERRDQWLALEKRFGFTLDWSGHEDWMGLGWQKQLHIFQVPFYYIEYGIAQIGALQLWRHWRESPERAVELYRAALSLGGSRPLPDLFETAGLKFDFGVETLAPLMGAVREELAWLLK
jgi:oligoendopeptidase F